MVISAPVPNVVGIKIFSTPKSCAAYFTTSIELPPPKPINTEGFFSLNSAISEFTSSIEGSGVTLSNNI